MSDEEENEESKFVTHQILSKKRKVQRACDICRRKKIRCDGSQMPGNRCTNCITYDFTCTYVENAKKRGPPKGYVENLENRIEKLQALLHRIVPGADFTKDLETAEMQFTQSSVADHAATLIRRSAESLDGYTGGEHDSILLPDTLNGSPELDKNVRFFGKSSGAMFVKQALDLKMQYTGSIPTLTKTALRTARPEFWHTQPWEHAFVPPSVKHRFAFPEPDLLDKLVNLYFHNVNLFVPLLHRPTMERLIQEELHHSNDSFAAVLLLVCAVGSRYTDDPRVFLDNVDSSHSCGWKWFDQVQLVRKSLLSAPTLYDLQTYCLSVQFLAGTSAPQACWTMVGIGIRLAQDVGAHRAKTFAGALPRNIEDELWKRAWWVLVCMDRSLSSALGRPCVTQDEDYDVGLPVECDDEYWAHPDPEKAWKQPEGKPSMMSFFNQFLKLNTILGLALRTLYCIDKSKITFGLDGSDFELKVVTELDSTLNKWVDCIPGHLRWNPKNENDDWHRQSVVLYAHYYHLQILIHRPFIPSLKKPSRLAFPSLAICTNAARSCSHIIDVERSNCHSLMMQMQMPVFTSAVVLLLNIWGGKRAGLTSDPGKEMKDVYKCMDMLRICENTWQSAGRLWDILYELASVGDLPLPNYGPSPPSNKRARDSDAPITPPHSDPNSSPTAEGEERPIASNRRVMSVPSPLSSSSSHPDTPASAHSTLSPQQGVNPTQPYGAQYQELYARQHINAVSPSLPLSSDDLARMPLYAQPTVPPFTGTGRAGERAGSSQHWSNTQLPMGVGPESYLSSPSGASDQLFGMQQGGAPSYTVPPDPLAGSGTFTPGTQSQVQQEQAMLDPHLMAMWSSAPMGFELSDWGAYLSNVSEIQMSSNFDQNLRMNER